MITKNQFRCLIIISMLYMSVLFCSEILLHKLVFIGTIVISAGSLVAPLWFILSDVIAEVYGYTASKNMFYCLLIVDFLFSLTIVTLIHLPSPLNWHGQAAYNLVVGELLRQYFAGIVGILIGGIINIRLITKWKLILKGRYFWLRSIGASAIGETLFTTIAFFIILYGTPAKQHLFSLIIWGIILKVSANIILAFPANLLVFYLKKKKLTNIFDDQMKFNPFSKKKI